MPEDERDYWIADWEIQQLTCPDCGMPVEECSNPTRTFYPYRRVCYATMERVAASEAYRALHEKQPYHDGTFKSWAATRSSSHPVHFEAGVTIGAATEDLAPWDAFTTQVDASPVAPDDRLDDRDEAEHSG